MQDWWVLAVPLVALVAAWIAQRRSRQWDRERRRLLRSWQETKEELRDSHARLEEFLVALENSPNGVVLLDENGRIEWCNQIAAVQFGIDATRDVLQHLANLVRDPAFVTYLASWNYSRDVVIDAPSKTLGRGGQPVRL